jgi:hypothetical protein
VTLDPDALLARGLSVAGEKDLGWPKGAMLFGDVRRAEGEDFLAS